MLRESRESVNGDRHALSSPVHDAVICNVTVFQGYCDTEERGKRGATSFSLLSSLVGGIGRIKGV